MSTQPKNESLKIRTAGSLKERLQRIADRKMSSVSHEARQAILAHIQNEEREAAAAEESEVAA